MFKWSDLIPNSGLQWGAYFMVLAVFLVYVDVPNKGVPWDKIGAGFAFLGGFGIGGAAGGWVGSAFASIAGTVLSKGGEFLAKLLGASVVGAIFLGLMLWTAARVRKGIDSKSKSMLKLKALIAVAILAIVGSILSSIPGAYGAFDYVASSVGTALRGTVS